MAQEPASKALTGGWELVKTFTGPNLPRGVVVKNHENSSAEAEIFIIPLHGDSAPTSQEGFPLAIGGQHSFSAFQANGGVGHIGSVYGKSTSATVHVASDLG